MIRMFLTMSLVFGLSAAASAQTATPSSHLAFDEAGQAVTVAQGASYTASVDSAAGIALTGVTCVAGTPSSTATCTANFPAMTPGTHTVTVTQTISGASSSPSVPLSVTFVIVVTPTNPRVVP